MNDVQTFKLREFYNKNKTTYFEKRSSNNPNLWNENTKWDILPDLNKEFSGISKVDVSDEEKIMKKLRSANQRINVVTWRDNEIFSDHIKSGDGMFSKILNYLWFSGDSEIDLIEKSNKIVVDFNENPMSPATFSFILSAKDCNKFAPNRDFIYKGILEIIGEKGSVSRGEKYKLLNNAANLVGEWISEDKTGEDFQQKALNGQDFLYLQFSKNYSFCDEIRSKVEDFLIERPDFVSKIEPNNEEMNKRLEEFRLRFSLEKIQSMSDEDFLNSVPFRKNNVETMSRELEYGSLKMFGGIGGGSAGKLGFYQGNDGFWKNMNNKPIDEEEVIPRRRAEFAKIGEIAELIKTGKISKITEVTQKYKNGFERALPMLVWVRKYLTVLFPEKFVPIYSDRISQALGMRIKSDWFEDSNALTHLAKEFGLSNYEFGRVLAQIFNDENSRTDGFVEEDVSEKFEVSDKEFSKAPKNLILYGPPGTGKTYSIERRREELGVSKENFTFITFHQSYSYEDFIEGLKAKIENGQVVYAIENGIFKEICREAQDNPTKNFLLVIDEINRGNISKIFGELITLIEESKRGDERFKVKLPYSKETFVVPKNLYIIGTMNSTDHSVAAIDNALRRRFSFERMNPNYDVIQEKSSFEGEKLAKFAQDLNERISSELDFDHEIGHSYFMNIDSAEDLEKSWEQSILPLIDSYVYGDLSVAKEILGRKVIEEKAQGSKFKYKKLNAREILSLFEEDTVQNENE